jgi:hypothetical protein
MKYMIIRAKSIDQEEAIKSVEKRVNELLKYGARLCGGVSIAVDTDYDWVVCQALVID